MSWAKIKTTLNSTLGTKDSKPLDKIVEDGFNEMKSNIENGNIISGKSKKLDSELDLDAQYNLMSNEQIISHSLDKGIYIVWLYYKRTSIQAGGENTFILNISDPDVFNNDTKIESEYIGYDFTFIINNNEIIIPKYSSSIGTMTLHLKCKKIL